MNARRTIALTCSAAAIGAGAIALAGHHTTRARHPVSVVSASSPAQSAGTTGRPLAGSAIVRFDLVLRIREPALQVYLRGLFEKGSASYGHYLSAAAFGRRFGLSHAAASLLGRRLHSLGITVDASYPQMTSLRVRASAATLRRTLGVVMRAYRGAGGLAYQAPDRAATVPPGLRPWVLDVAGLSTRPVAHTDSLPSAAGGALRPMDVRSAYDVNPLYTAGADGRGQTIAVLSIDGFSLTGYERFAQAMGLPSTAPKIVRLQTPQLSGSGETNLDTEIIHSIAPAAHIVDYQIAFQDLPDVVNQIVAHHSATVISGSFGACDTSSADPRSLALDPGMRSDTEAALSAAAAAGVTFVFSTGDAGAYECSRYISSDHNLTVEFPADAPYTLAVGGTVLSVANNESYAGETAWGDAASVAGGGGGLNPRDAAPAWQSAVRVPGVSNGHRQTPDVSAASGAGSPWYTNDGGKASDGWGASYGTSAAAPFWAASLLLIQQYMQLQKAGSLCFATPLLYAIAESSWQKPPFHDVTSGTNLFYQATQGWDFATGWGSPDVAAIAGAAVTYRHQNPLPAGGCRGAEATSSPSSSSSSSGPLATLTRYWRDIGTGNYAGAYGVLAPGAVNLSQAQFAASHQQAGIESIQFSGVLGSSSGSSATVDVRRLLTRSRQAGCQAWSGSYAMTKQSGWLIARADIASARC
jgi:kumamolisin